MFETVGRITNNFNEIDQSRARQEVFRRRDLDSRGSDAEARQGLLVEKMIQERRLIALNTAMQDIERDLSSLQQTTSIGSAGLRNSNFA